MTLGDFTVKKKKKKRTIWKGNLYLTESPLSRNEMWRVIDNYSYICHICIKGSLDPNFNQTVADKISISRNFPIFYVLTKIVILKVWLERDRPTASTLYTFYGRDM